MKIECSAPVEKFRDYVLKPGADQGKFKIFQSLGYTQESAEQLVTVYTQQAAERYESGDYLFGRKDIHGQRITIEITLNGIGDTSDKVSHLASGWLLTNTGTIRLITPFAGFTRPQGQEE